MQILQILDILKQSIRWMLIMKTDWNDSFENEPMVMFVSKTDQTYLIWEQTIGNPCSENRPTGWCQLVGWSCTLPDMLIWYSRKMPQFIRYTTLIWSRITWNRFKTFLSPFIILGRTVTLFHSFPRNFIGLFWAVHPVLVVIRCIRVQSFCTSTYSDCTRSVQDSIVWRRVNFKCALPYQGKAWLCFFNAYVCVLNSTPSKSAVNKSVSSHPMTFSLFFFDSTNNLSGKVCTCWGYEKKNRYVIVWFIFQINRWPHPPKARKDHFNCKWLLVIQTVRWKLNHDMYSSNFHTHKTYNY